MKTTVDNIAIEHKSQGRWRVYVDGQALRGFAATRGNAISRHPSVRRRAATRQLGGAGLGSGRPSRRQAAGCNTPSLGRGQPLERGPMPTPTKAHLHLYNGDKSVTAVVLPIARIDECTRTFDAALTIDELRAAIQHIENGDGTNATRAAGAAFYRLAAFHRTY